MIYTYRCECGAEFEERHPMSDVPQEVPCHECDGMAKKVFLAPNVVYKGRGWGNNPEHGEKTPSPWEFDDLYD